MTATTIQQYSQHLLDLSVAALTVAPGADPCVPGGVTPPTRQVIAWAEPVDWPCDYVAVWVTNYGFYNGAEATIGDTRSCVSAPYARFCVRVKRCKSDLLDGEKNVPTPTEITAQSEEQAIDMFLLQNALFLARNGGTLLPPAILQPFQEEKMIAIEPTVPVIQQGMMQGLDTHVRVPIYPIVCP